MFRIDKQSRIPLYEQLIASIEESILLDLLNIEEKIPSVRSLSTQLAINPNTIQKAYTDLERRKITYSVPGSGRYIAENAKELLRAGNSEDIEKLKEVLSALKLFGVSKEDVLTILNDIYDNE